MRAKNKRRKTAALLLMLLALSGCGPVQDAGDMVMIEQEREEITYELAVATVGDVEKSLSFKCTYEQEDEEDISFSISGKKISAVYVKEGDHVEKGQLLAELSGGSLDTQIEDLEYRIARNKLLLEHSKINENYEISRRWLEYMYSPYQASADSLKAGIASFQQSCTYSREDYQDAIALDELQLAQMKEELEKSRVYAGLTGTVTFLREGLEGSTSTKGEKIMTIIDGSKCLFVTRKEECAQYFSEGTEAEVSITSGTGAGKYTVVPYKMEEWGEKQTFTMAGDKDGNIIEVGTMGTLKIVVGYKENVLNIPEKAVHTADGKNYVYVVGENNMREIKWIETGLHGDRNVEVVSGLSRGEKVVLR